MDWIRDDAILGADDLKNVFTFKSRPTTVLRKLSDDEKPVVWSLEGKEEWDNWFETDLPKLDGTASGLVLILVRRAGEPNLPQMRKVNSDEWLQCLDNELLKLPHGKRRGHFTAPGLIDQDLKRLPFSRDLFLEISKKFYVHNTIVRTISRTDIPAFSRSRVHMTIQNGWTCPAYVYHFRTTNTWLQDSALAVTYFPHYKMTFAMLFGCHVSTEHQIIQRLNSAAAEASHPLLVPGIFVELERIRHLHIIQRSISEIEARMLRINSNPGDMKASGTAQRLKDNNEKREQWLDTTYLRNQLLSWNAELREMASHTEELTRDVFRSQRPSDSPAWTPSRSREPDVIPNSVDAQEYLHHISLMIRNRLQDIIVEYEDKVRDCSMRIDGMAMATQWAQGETSTDIALATGRDSRHMMSISLVTMVFLPGTFFASFFSMTFFDWSTPSGRPAVSGYLWIYIVVTAVFTWLTIAPWWYFGIYRQRPSPKMDATSVDEEKGSGCLSGFST